MVLTRRILGIVMIAVMAIVYMPEIVLADEVNDSVAQVDCCDKTTGIVKSDGSLWMTGCNDNGQLGDGTTEEKITPVKIMDDVAQVSCGYDHTGIVKSDGSLWMTGRNYYGELGDGTTEEKITPVKIMDDVAQVSCGFGHTGILKNDGSLWMTGRNYFSNSMNESEQKPIKIMDDVAQVSCGYSHTGILKNDGSLWMVGHNDYGQIGDGTTEDITTFTKITIGSGSTDVNPVSRINYQKDTWSFRNYEETFSYEDYAKFFTPAVAALMSKKMKKAARCYGFCLLIPSIKDYGFPESMAGKEIHSFQKTKEVRQWIRYAYIAQLIPALIEEEAINSNSYDRLYNAVKHSLEGNGDMVCIAMDDHEVLPVSILKDTKDEVWIDTYDCNYPDHLDNGEPAYTTLVLYGENGHYDSCKYFLSREYGVNNAIKVRAINNLSYTTETQSFINAYLHKIKINLFEWSGASANGKICRLLDIKQSSNVTFSDITEAYPIHLKDGEGEDANDSLYWIKDDDDQMTITGLEPGNEITLSSDYNSICIKADNKADVSLTVNEYESYADISMANPGTVEVECFSGDETVTEVSSKLAATENILFNFEGGTVSASGVTAIQINSKTGKIDESGELIGDTKEFSKDNIDPNNKYSVNVISDDKPSGEPSKPKPAHQHSYGKWITSKAATELASGTQTRKCSVCGSIETKTIAQLKPTLKAVKILKTDASKRSVTIGWKKITKKNLKKIKKIQIQYSTDKNFKKAVKSKYAKAKKTSYKVKGLKKGKKYYVRIRAYTKSGNTVHVSKWSAKKSVKAK